MTPLHTHPESDETMYVLEGEILMHMDGAEHRVGAGGLAVAPRGVPHAFLVLSPTARLLCLHTPGCLPGVLLGRQRAGRRRRRRSAGRSTSTEIHASAAHNGGIVILGPPPFTHD